MPARFSAADLIVCRSGATTCAELTVAGKAAVLVPFAAATGDHQLRNAQALEAAGAARIIQEGDLTGAALASRVREIVETTGRLEAMEEASGRLGRPDAAARVADLLTERSHRGTETQRPEEEEEKRNEARRTTPHDGSPLSALAPHSWLPKGTTPLCSLCLGVSVAPFRGTRA
jgi:UDP-N-acetylglucosamine--N-acetylmuramyl-(pentapeptide) pyrophosphoryl-undecaprenol N-acetylglucosamine transferase